MIGQNPQDDLAFVLNLLRRAHSIEGDSQRALDRIVEVAGESLHSTACTLVLVDLANETAKVAACWPSDGPFRDHMVGRQTRLGDALGPGMVRGEDARLGNWLELYHLKDTDYPVSRRDTAVRFGLDALLGCPIRIGGQVAGYLNHFIGGDRVFGVLEKQLLAMLADRAAAALESTQRAYVSRSYEQLSRILQQIDAARTIDEVLQVVLDGALALTGKARGWVSQLVPETGQLEISRCAGGPAGRSLRYGQGVTGYALQECRPVRVDDVGKPDWEEMYEVFWPDTRSELAVPIMIRGASALKGRTEVPTVKRLGVINVESAERGAFSAADEDLLGSLASHAAVVIDRMDLDRKLAELWRVQQQIVRKEDWDEIVRIVTRAIAKALRYEYVNISVVHHETQSIDTEYVIGLPQGSPDEFKQRARHRLDSNDIQCDIVNHRYVEVPEADDPRFDPRVYRAFGHDRLIRVFMPMIAASTNRVIGTIDAGYPRADWLPIYQEDVRILRQFVDYAAEALMRRRRGILDEITHELRAPVVGIRSNVSYMERRFDQLDKEFMIRKFGDMQADCEVLLYQVTELEYFLGRPQPVPRIERTLVFRDVIIAAIQQLKPTLKERGFDLSKIEYDPDDVRRVGALYVDRTQLKQVVFNLLLNSIKYAEDAPEKFTIRIGVDSTREHFVVSFRDWGIGVQEEYAGRVFDTGFRTPEAVDRMVAGSGLGLTISRRIMREMGGDLRLVRYRKPIEFQLFLPRRLQEEPDDFVH